MVSFMRVIIVECVRCKQVIDSKNEFDLNIHECKATEGHMTHFGVRRVNGELLYYGNPTYASVTYMN